MPGIRSLRRKVRRALRGQRTKSLAPPVTYFRSVDSNDSLQRERVCFEEQSGPPLEQPDGGEGGSEGSPEQSEHVSKQECQYSEGSVHVLERRDHSLEGSVQYQANLVKPKADPVQTTLAPGQKKRLSVKLKRAPAPPKAAPVLNGAVSVGKGRTYVKTKRPPPLPRPSPVAAEPESSGRDVSSGASTQRQNGGGGSDGSFLERLPEAMVGEVASPVITQGPHKLGPAALTERPHKAATVASSEPRLAVTEGAVIGRSESPPGTEPDDASVSDADSGTADVLDDPLTPGTPEPEPEPEARDRRENPHRVVISVTQAVTEIHGPLGCQEVPPVVVRLQPGDQGRYGFNVKGGAGSSIPVTVSKVAPRSATRCSGPRLSEGDQVMLINGVDVSTFSHRDVVRFIKSCRDRQCELELTVKPNLTCEGLDDLEEPLVRYVPDTAPLSLAAPDATTATLTLAPDASPLARSIAELAHALTRGVAQLEFDGLPRRELSLTMDDCRLPSNIAKNRYRDISPYDCSRVLLRTAESGDYINANFVNMEIPGSGIVNRYIAAQGPLHNTTDDFWAMVWEQKCPLVVMLTTLVEQGRVKCHQYWPEVGQSQLFGDLQVTTVSEEVTDNFAFRDIALLSQETGEERHISHMQYVSWPDHGVPEQAADFVQFVQRVRAARAGLSEPTVVHCSAGIGRTGVLILMETAMCLVEANQPVCPLELVRCMRRQRAMMIQTTSQFEFVCEAVVQTHRAGTVRPLPEFAGRD